jgi:hypothetical protein
LWIKGNSTYIYEKQEDLCCETMTLKSGPAVHSVGVCGGLWGDSGDVMEMYRAYGDVELNEEGDEERAREGVGIGTGNTEG